MNRTKIHWLVGDSLPEHASMLEAVPGVGNVGKLVVDSLVEKHPSRTLGMDSTSRLPSSFNIG